MPRIRQAGRQAGLAGPCDCTQRAFLPARVRRPQLHRTSLLFFDGAIAGSRVGVISTIPNRNGRTFECDYLLFCMPLSERWRSMLTTSRKTSSGPTSRAVPRRCAMLRNLSLLASSTRLARVCGETSSALLCSESCFAHTPTNRGEWTLSTPRSGSFSRHCWFSPRSRSTRVRRRLTNGSLSSASELLVVIVGRGLILRRCSGTECPGFGCEAAR